MPLFTAGDVLTAAKMNAINGYVLKTADESVTSSAALQNDDHLFYTIPTVGTYAVDAWLFGTSAANAAGDLQYGFTFPAGTFYAFSTGLDINLASGTSGTSLWAAQTATSGVAIQAFGLSTGGTAMHIHGLFVATATGTLRLQWAQNASNANASTLKAGSHMLVRQVA
jgi:hypothetical protein